MKICIIAPDYPSQVGGVEIVNWNLSENFVKLGHEVHIITICDIDELNAISENIIVHHEKIPRIHHKLKPPFSNLFYIVEAMIYIIKTLSSMRKIRPDIIQAQGSMEAVPSWLSKILFGIPYVLTIHGDLSNEDANPGFAMPRCIKKIWKDLPYIKTSDSIISLTQSGSRGIYNVLRRDSIIIPNGVDTNIFCSETRPSPTPVRLVSVGRLHKDKGFDKAIHAIKYTLSDYTDVHLTIIGDGDEKEHLHNLIKSLNLDRNVSLIGSIPHTKIPKYLENSSIYLMTSRTEGFPLVILEAMAIGLPIISTPVGSIDEIINQYNNGIIISTDKLSSISDAIKKLTDDPEYYSTCSINSIIASKEYSWERVAKKYIQVYCNILNELGKTI